MVRKRFLLSAMVLACLGSACTAIVLGSIGDTKDYKTVTTLGGSTLDDCSLLKGTYRSDADASTCSECIQTGCAAEVKYACNGGSVNAKPWFQKMKDCAQHPAQLLGGGTEWDCKEFEDASAVISDNGSDTEQSSRASRCINEKCMQTDTPPCKQCPVTIQKSQDDPTLATLETDDCGQCLAKNCQAALVKCCGSAPMKDFVQHCAFTRVAANKTACLALGKPDATNGARYDGLGTACLPELSECFKANCAADPGCQ